MIGRPPKYDWGGVDWRKNDAFVALRLSCSIQTVAYQRKKVGVRPDTPRKRTHKWPRKHWNRIAFWLRAPWHLPDRVIALHAGCSRQNVSRWRALLGKEAYVRVRGHKRDDRGRFA